MNLTLSETQLLVQKTARDFTTRVLLPQAASFDRNGAIPKSVYTGLAELGLMSVKVPEEYGGAGAGAVAYALAMQEIARGCAGTAVTMATTNMVGEVVSRLGTEAQRRYVCPKLARGEWPAASFALSEPGAGSDPGGMLTTARRDGDGWVIDGSKQWITAASVAGVFVVWARTGPKETHPGTRGISAFIVEADRPGLRVAKSEDKMGIRGSNTSALELDGCRLPDTALLGQENGGFKIAMMTLDGGRIGISAQAIGIARAALEESVAYAKDRRQFDRPIGEFQAIQWKLANMKTELDAAHLLCMRAAWLKESGRPFSREASIAKLFATEAANRICREAVQIHGGYGYTREFAAERHMRDVRVTMIYEGTSEIQRMVIGRSVLGA